LELFVRFVVEDQSVVASDNLEWCEVEDVNGLFDELGMSCTLKNPSSSMLWEEVVEKLKSSEESEDVVRESVVEVSWSVKSD
jgi:hypothetical protein